VPSIESSEPAREAFARWAALQAGAPADPASLVEGVETADESAGLLVTELEGRRPVWRTVPAPSHARVTPVSVSRVDAWSDDPRELRVRSDHIATCDVCHGEKKVRCGECSGSGRMVCTFCRGAGKHYGYASNGSRRLLNCAPCRGRGNVECGQCRRGLTVCTACAGEGRLQRWVEIETWRRSEETVHPAPLVQQLAWRADVADEVLAHDGQVLVNAEQRRQLTSADLDAQAVRWLEILSPKLQPGERVTHQRLRIVLVPATTVRYRLGNSEDRLLFAGRTLQPPAADTVTEFTRRTGVLQTMRNLLMVAAALIAMFLFAAAPFGRSLLNLLSFAGFVATFVSLYGFASDWTAARRRLRSWLITAACTFLLAIAFAALARPHAGHAAKLIAAHKLDAAESELQALGNNAPPPLWYDLRLARVREASDVAAARALADQIPQPEPQHAEAMRAVDQLILASVARDAGAQRWQEGAETLALLSEASGGSSTSAAAAKSVCLPLAQQLLGRFEWANAAKAIVTARHAGVGSADLAPLADTIHRAAMDALSAAADESNAQRRLSKRLKAEQILLAWETAAGTSGTPALIALRAAMARDVAAAERSTRHGRTS
jgi:hypothetical protein